MKTILNKLGENGQKTKSIFWGSIKQVCGMTYLKLLIVTPDPLLLLNLSSLALLRRLRLNRVGILILKQDAQPLLIHALAFHLGASEGDLLRVVLVHHVQQHWLVFVAASWGRQRTITTIRKRRHGWVDIRLVDSAHIVDPPWLGSIV